MALLRSAREDGQAEGGRRGTHPPVERGQGGGGGPDREGEVKRVQGAEGHPRGHQNSLRVAVRLRNHRKAKEEPFFHVGEKATIDARADGVGKAPLSLTASDRRRDLGQCEVGDEEVLPSHERAIEDGAFRLGKIDLHQRARVEVDGPGDGEGSPGHWLLSALLAVFADRGGQRGVEDGKGAPECAASREAPGQGPRGGYEACDGLSPVGQDQLVAAPHLLDQGREVLARFADAGSLHAINVLHVAHRGKRKEGNHEMSPVIERLAELRSHLDHLAKLAPRVPGAEALRTDMSLRNDVLFSLFMASQLVIDIAAELSARSGRRFASLVAIAEAAPLAE
jgi:hypothetical protein